MMTTDTASRSTSPGFLRFCAVIGVIGVAAMVLGNIVGSLVVPGYDAVADTVSQLAAGRFEIIQDVALYALAGGIVALALGAAHCHAGDAGWGAGTVMLAVIAAAVVVIGARNEYGDGDSDGVVVHIYVVYVMGLVFFAAPLAMAAGLRARSPVLARAAIGLALVWGAGAGLYFNAPDEINGAVERAIGLVAMAFLLLLARFFWIVAAGAAKSDASP